MQSVLIGVGQAGGKLTRALVDYDSKNDHGAVRGALAVNSASADLHSLPASIETVLVGQSRVGGHGVGGDNELGAQVMSEDVDEVMGALDGTVTAHAEAIFVVAGLGGGTGSGGAPVLVRELQRIYDRPVYGIGILPGRDEGALYQVNAGRSLKTLAREADSVLLVDNDAFRSAGESIGSGYASINEAIARRIGLLLAAGESTGGHAESVVDASEVINTLRSGRLATLGFATAEVGSDATEAVSAVTSTTRQALLTGTSLPEATTASAALLVVAGRPEAISRKGVERARRWLEEEIESMEVRGGDFPLDDDSVASVVLLSGVERTDRVQSFFQRAHDARGDPETTANGAADDGGGDADAADERDAGDGGGDADGWGVDELDDLT